MLFYKGRISGLATTYCKAFVGAGADAELPGCCFFMYASASETSFMFTRPVFSCSFSMLITSPILLIPGAAVFGAAISLVVSVLVSRMRTGARVERLDVSDRGSGVGCGSAGA